MSKLNIQNWLSKLSETVKNNDFENHMALFSENLASYDKANGISQNYYNWRNQRQTEFQSGLLKNISYDKLSIKNIGLRRLTFRIEETLIDSRNAQNTISKEIILEHEHDEQWRMVEETIKR